MSLKDPTKMDPLKPETEKLITDSLEYLVDQLFPPTSPVHEAVRNKILEPIVEFVRTHGNHGQVKIGYSTFPFERLCIYCSENLRLDCGENLDIPLGSKEEDDNNPSS